MIQSSIWTAYQRRRRRARAIKRNHRRRGQLTFEAIEPRIVLATTVIDINPTGDSLVTPPDRVPYMPIGDVTFFVADDGSSGQELWITDGTESGTRQVKDINPGPDSSYPGVFHEFNGELYFVANDGVNGEELWKSDGTESGTILLSDINPGSGYQYPYGDGPLQSFPRDFTEHNGVLLFSAEDAVNGAELWRTDGTAAGTVLLTDIFPGSFDDGFGQYPNSSNPTGLVEFNGEVYFAADDGASGRELWKTDGTATGTVLVKDIYTGQYNYVRDGNDYGTYPNSSSPAQMTVVGDTLFFVARDVLLLGETPEEDQSNYELWKTDGTEAGTVKVREINPGDDASLNPNSELFDINGLLVFAADDGISGEELWRSDGTEDGTIIVKDFMPGIAGNLSDYAYFTVHNGDLYFSADDGVSGQELWRSNGTPNGTQLVKDIAPGGDDGVPLFLESVNGLLYFTAVNDDAGAELWRSDGTDAGTFLLEDLIPGSDSAVPSDFSSAGDALIFAADDGRGRELWVRTEDAQPATASLTVFVESEEVDIPTNVGVEVNGDTGMVYTNASGALEFITGDAVTVGDFFDVWRTDAGQVVDNPAATFSETELMGNAVDADHTVQMFVNGQSMSEYADYVLRPDDNIVLIYGENPVVSLVTNFGSIVIELFEEDTPITVDNFLDYVNDESYVNAIFHRSDPGFVIQGGGFRTTSPTLVDLNQITEIPANAPILNEPGIPNTRATVAMAKLGGDPNSATNQFFVNLADNRSILDGQNGGFTVFGQVLDMTTADAIAALPIENADGAVFAELPVSSDDVIPTILALDGNGEITGRRYDDVNTNGSYDAGEEVVGAVVYVDKNSNGQLDVGESQATTDAEGRYLLLAEPGAQTVRSGGRAEAVSVDLGRTMENVDFVDIMHDPPTEIDLLAVSDLGTSDTDNLTRLNNSSENEVLQFFVSGASDGVEVRLYSDGIQVGSGIAFGSTVTVATDGMTTLANGVHAFTATIAVGNQETDPSPALNIEILARALGDFVTAPPDQAQVGQPFSFDVGSSDEGNDLAYSLIGAPSGMEIDGSTGVISWTPNPSQAIPVTFDIVASDSAGNSITQIVDMVVLGAIAAFPDSYQVDEDMTLTVDASQGVLENDDGGDEVLTATVVNPPTNGNVSLNSDGSFTYTPNPNFSGEDSFTYMAMSGTDDSNVAEVTIVVDPVNDPPVGNSDSYTTQEDVVLTVSAAQGVLQNDTDADGDNLVATIATQASNGVLVLLSDGSITYTPDADFSGDDSFTYTVSDGTEISAPISVTLEVTNVDDPPVADVDSYTVSEDESLTVGTADGVLANDTDVEGATLTAQITSQPSNGAVALNSDGSFTYTPIANFFGTDTFRYRASDGVSDSAETEVTINVSGVADDPTANDDSFDVSNNGLSQSLDVLANDIGEPNVDQALTITEVTQGSEGGTVTLDGGTLNYTPAEGFVGEETFTYTVEDTDGLTDTATVTINVTEVGDSAISGFVFIDRNSNGVRDTNEPGIPGSLVRLTGTDKAGNSVNETFLTTDTGFYSFEELPSGTYAVHQSQPAATVDGMASADMDDVVIRENEIANIVLTGDQTLIENNFGEQTLRAEFISIAWFFASSGNGNPDAQTLRNLVAMAEERAGNAALAASIRAGSTEGPANTAPVAFADDYSVAENGELTVSTTDGVLANDTDANDDPLTANLANGVTNGTLSLEADGSFTYTPDADFTGTDSFTYTASDGVDSSNQVEVEITVTANTAPVASTDSYTVAENGELTVDAAEGVLANDTDTDGDTLTANLDDTTQNGTLTFNSDGSFTYTPDDDFAGVDSFTYTASDGADSSNQALVTIIVDDDVPVQTGDNEFTISENTPSGTVIGSVTPSAALGSQRIYEIVNNQAPPEIALNADDHLSGDPNVQLVLIEYLDLQCPICAQFHPIIESLKDEFDDELLVVSRHLPLESIHPNARSAARSAEAAARQGAFDEMVDLMFTLQDEWEFASDPQPFFDGYADSLGLDLVQFASDRVDPDIDARIQRDIDDAQALADRGVTSGLATPTFFFEGRFLSNNDALDDFAEIIEDELDDFDAPFVVDRLSGEIIAAPGVSFNASSTPQRNFNVRVADVDGVTTTEAVTVNVVDPQAASSAAAVDAAFAELE